MTTKPMNLDELEKEFDERFTEKDAFGEGRWWETRVQPEYVKQFYREKIKQMLEWLVGDDDDFDVWKEGLNKINKINGDKKMGKIELECLKAGIYQRNMLRKEQREKIDELKG